MSRRVRAAVPTAVLVAVLALTGCVDQPEEANNNGPETDPSQPAGVIRTPAPAQSAPLTVPLPGETNSPDVSGDMASESASASPEPSSVEPTGG